MTPGDVRWHGIRVGVITLVVAACAVMPAFARAESRAALLAAAGVPKPVELPQPEGAVALPDDYDKGPILIRLSQKPPGQLVLRRVSAGDGRLYLGLRAEGGGLGGTAEVSCGGRQFRADMGGGELWLSLRPQIGRVTVRVSAPDVPEPVELVAPTTLVEVRGRQIFVNGEPFMIKGAMSRNLNERDAAYVHSLGINTLRGFEALADCERYGFMSITSLNLGKGATKQAMAAGDAEFAGTLAESMKWLRDNSASAVASPNTLILQLGNEKTGGAADRPGSQPPNRARRHVSQLLASAYNVIKPLAPSLPVGYANQDLGYLAPDCMDVYMHNSFLDKDRYGYPWEDFMRWQGCLPPDGAAGQGRPFVNSEFGSNRYLCQAYHGGPNNPVLEKIHAWNFPQRWAEFMGHGTAGGAIYCMYDLERPTDQGCSCFGILTNDGKPKLACWEIGHMWRDFEVEVRAKELVISYKRDYWARGCRLIVKTPGGKEVTHPLGDFAGHSSQTIAMADLSLGEGSEFEWKVDYATHAGLPNEACGAWPARAEERAFLKRLKGRETYSFLSELFDTRVVTTEGMAAPPTLAEMSRSDGIIPVALRKPNGVTYLLLISREKPDQGGPLLDGVTVDVAFRGKVEMVDDMTGEPLGRAVEAVGTPGGLRLRNVQAARIPGAIGERSDVPFKLPIYRITP